MAERPTSKAAMKQAAATQAAKKINSFSRVPGLPRPAAAVPRPPGALGPEEQSSQDSFVTRRRSFERTDSGRARLDDPVTKLAGQLGVPHHEALRTIRNMGMGLGHDEVENQHAEQTGVHPLRGRAVPDINAPHDITSTVIPQRRWEDLHPNERAATLQAAKQHGVTPASAERDYSSQLAQSHARAVGTGGMLPGHATPYSQNFYSGPSGPRDKLLESGAANAKHPNFPAGVDSHVVQSVANSITSPRNKFEIDKGDGSPKLYPNDEHANHAIRHALDAGPSASSEDVAASIGNAHGPGGGGIMGNIRRAAFASHQLMFKGATPQTLRNPPGEKAKEKGATEGNKAFGTPNTQKTTAYVGAWMHPEDPDSFLTTDVHTGHGFAAHLSTAKQDTGRIDENGKKVLGSSEVEEYIAKTPHVHAMHDYIARKVHAKMGLSPSTSNAQYLNRGQAAQWGEERIQRPDLTDATQERVYPRDPARHGVDPSTAKHTSLGSRSTVEPPRVSQVHDDLPTGRDRDKLERGIAARSAATTAKRPVKPAGDDKFADDDAWAPRNQSRSSHFADGASR